MKQAETVTRKKEENPYHIIDSWYGSVKRFSTLKDAKSNARQNEAIWKGSLLVGYGGKQPNTVQ